jgi:hypothetical protein
MEEQEVSAGAAGAIQDRLDTILEKNLRKNTTI